MTFQPYSVTVLLTVQIKGKLRYLMAYRWRSITALKILMKKLNLLLGDLKTPTCRLLRCYLWLEMNPLHLFVFARSVPADVFAHTDQEALHLQLFFTRR